MMAQKITHLIFNDYACGYIEMREMKSEFLLLKNHYIMNEYLTPFVSKYTQHASRGFNPRNRFSVDDFIAHLLDLIKHRKKTTNLIREKKESKNFEVVGNLEIYWKKFEALKNQLVDIIDLHAWKPEDLQIFGIMNGSINEVAFGEAFWTLVGSLESSTIDELRFIRQMTEDEREIDYWDEYKWIMADNRYRGVGGEELLPGETATMR
jgi:hypothetical protein